MSIKAARIVSFILSTVALVLALVYFTSDNKDAMKPVLYVGLVFVLSSLVFRNLLRFKPDVFKNSAAEETKVK